MKPTEEDVRENKKSVWISTFFKFKDEMYKRIYNIETREFYMIIGMGILFLLQIGIAIVNHK
jgi:hypothetical protein